MSLLFDKLNFSVLKYQMTILNFYFAMRLVSQMKDNPSQVIVTLNIYAASLEEIISPHDLQVFYGKVLKIIADEQYVIFFKL